MPRPSLFVIFSLALFTIAPLNSIAQKVSESDADVLVAEKRYTEAAAIYKKLLDKKPKDRKLVLKLADTYFEAENYVQAKNFYSKYFNDTVYSPLPQFRNYVIAEKENGDIAKTNKLLNILSSNGADGDLAPLKSQLNLYTDSAKLVRSFSLDSTYYCIDLDATASVDSMAQPIIYIWSFSDGGSESGVQISHCFPGPGAYTATLSIRDRETGIMRSNDTSLVINVQDKPVKFTSPSRAKRYFNLNFDGSASNAPGYETLQYLWDLGNGDTRMGPRIRYQYMDFGEYNVTLTLVARNKNTGALRLFSANKKLVVSDNYVPPDKTVQEQ